MTPALMQPHVRTELANLSEDAKASLRAFAANKLTVISGRAQLIVADTKDGFRLSIESDAEAIERAVQAFIDGLNELLGETT